MCTSLVLRTDSNVPHARDRMLVDSTGKPVATLKPKDVTVMGFRSFLNLAFSDLVNLKSVRFTTELPDGTSTRIAMKVSTAEKSTKAITVRSGSTKMVFSPAKISDGKYFDTASCKAGCVLVMSKPFEFEMSQQDFKARRGTPPTVGLGHGYTPANREDYDN